ncbi:hypothetical protein GCM10011504_50520 [Siccirubricoccus deserti]|nr:hypothetical protein GCM10011504_50520 [Siccirubricoccus deserti]
MDVSAGARPVTQADVTRFAAGFPLFARWLNVVLGPRLAKPEGAAAASANAVATSALGIPVDMRVGSLVSPSAVSDAICLAAGSDDYAPGDRRAECLARFVECQVPRVGIRGPGEWWSDGLFGAAWSCDVDAALNRPTAWSRNRARGFKLFPENEG